MLRVTKNTRDKLATYGQKGMTWDQIVQRLMEAKEGKACTPANNGVS